MPEPETITEQLLAKLPLVSFVQLMRCLQIETGVPVGSSRITDQPVKLVCNLDTNFPANELSHWESVPNEDRPKLHTNFFGLYGANGALPEHYTRLIMDRVRERDFALRDFLDIFNHRLLSLFYRAWEKNCFSAAFETAVHCGKLDSVTLSLQALIGNRRESSRQQLSEEDQILLYFAGAIASSRRPNAATLQQAVAFLTGFPTNVETFVGQWLQLSPADQSRIGSPRKGVTWGNRIGVDTIVGQRVWSFESRFQVTVGPMKWNDFQSFLPIHSKLKKLARFIRRFVGPTLDFDMRFLVDRTEVRGVTLTENAQAQLGWNTWLGEWKQAHDAQDAVFMVADEETNQIE